MCIALAMSAIPAAAIEIQVTITTDELDAAHGGDDPDTGMSLREAIVEANQNPGEDTVLLEAMTYDLTRNGACDDVCSTGDLDITDDLVLLGAGIGLTTIDAHRIDRLCKSSHRRRCASSR